jgi:hypothetical protein
MYRGRIPIRTTLGHREMCNKPTGDRQIEKHLKHDYTCRTKPRVLRSAIRPESHAGLGLGPPVLSIDRMAQQSHLWSQSSLTDGSVISEIPSSPSRLASNCESEFAEQPGS